MVMEQMEVSGSAIYAALCKKESGNSGCCHFERQPAISSGRLSFRAIARNLLHNGAQNSPRGIYPELVEGLVEMTRTRGVAWLLIRAPKFCICVDLPACLLCLEVIQDGSGRGGAAAGDARVDHLQ